VSYSLVRTTRGGFSVSVYHDKAGADESTRAAREWIAKNASKTGVARPTISEGTVMLQLKRILCSTRSPRDRKSVVKGKSRRRWGPYRIQNYHREPLTTFRKGVMNNKGEVESLIRGIKGFVSYSLVRTTRGGFSVSVYHDKAGADESTRAAREWIAKNASKTGVARPTISEGTVMLQLK